MPQRFEIDDHRALLTSRSDVEVPSFATETCMAVAVDVSARLLGDDQLPNGPTPDVASEHASIENAIRRRVSDQNGALVD